MQTTVLVLGGTAVLIQLQTFSEGMHKVIGNASGKGTSPAFAWWSLLSAHILQRRLF